MTDMSISNPSQAIEQYEAVIRYLFERVYSKGELHRIDDVIAPEAIGNSTESRHAMLGPAGFRSHIIRLRTAFDGLTVEIEDLHVQGDTFRVVWTATGTHERRFHRVEPTCHIGRVGDEPYGNPIAISGNTSGTFCDGKIGEMRTGWDAAELRRQLSASIRTAESETPVGKSERGKTILQRAAAVVRPIDHLVSDSGGTHGG